MSFVIEQPRFTCALAAQQTVLAIPRALPIIHAGPGCAAKVSQFASAGQQGEGYGGGLQIACTNSYEQEVVFGGEKKLRATIDGALRVLKGDLFVVLTGCTADIVGDDTINITKEFAEQGKPIVGVETAGFKGNSYYGHEAAVNAIIEQFVGEAEPKLRKGLVNVFSVVPYQDPFWRGDLEALKTLLESIGLEVNILFGYDSGGAAEWQDIPNAQFNLLVSPWVGLSTVKLLEEKYGTPFLHYPVLPVGALETNAFLRAVGTYAGIPTDTVERVIQKEEERYYQYLVSLLDFLGDYRTNLPSELYTVADSAYGLSFSSFLVNEAGFVLKGLYITDDAPQAYAALINEIAKSRDESFKDRTFFEVDGGLIQRDIKKKLGNSRKALFLGSSWEKLLARETNNLYTFVSAPISDAVIINKSFLGYRGGLQLIEEIYTDNFKTKQSVSRNTNSYAIEAEALKSL
ncbi:nitrogenase component 1 [Treponema primitia]|uniref:nitrogenase component 1 n=1 Tax=Treponema primitia TaxID=88058 RepID=UPI00025554C5|nr:nitrogenase component 1 [Treponema primitia]